MILSMRWLLHRSSFLYKYNEFYLARKCETQQTCKHTVEQLSRRQETHSIYVHNFIFVGANLVQTFCLYIPLVFLVHL